MKTVVMIAYGFPPEGNAGVYRPLRFVRHLRTLGWRPIVISLSTDFYERYDPNLADLVPRDTEVIRVRNRDPWIALQQVRAKRIQKKICSLPFETANNIQKAQQTPLRSFIRETVRTIEAWCYHPDVAMGWIRPAVKAVVNLCAEEKVDVIWATAGPVSSFMVAQRASQYTGVPYVLDFRDAWTITYNEFEERRPRWAQRADRRAMFRLLKGAQAVVFRYDTEAECYWRAYPGSLDTSRLYIIPNGYDGEIDKFTTPNGTRCNVLYTGTLADYRYDTLLQGIQLLKNSSPEEAGHLRFHFVGEGTEMLGKEAAALGIADIVTAAGPTSQEAITRLSREAHALLVLGRPPTMRGYELFAPAKLFGYLKAGRPILGILPADEANKLLRLLGVSTVANVDSVPEIVAVLRKLVTAWANGQLPLLIPDPAACQRYSAEAQTEALVCALKGRPPPNPFVPGRVKIPTSLSEDIARREREAIQKNFCGEKLPKRATACLENNK